MACISMWPISSVLEGLGLFCDPTTCSFPESLALWICRGPRFPFWGSWRFRGPMQFPSQGSVPWGSMGTLSIDYSKVQVPLSCISMRRIGSLMGHLRLYRGPLVPFPESLARGIRRSPTFSRCWNPEDSEDYLSLLWEPAGFVVL